MLSLQKLSRSGICVIDTKADGPCLGMRDSSVCISEENWEERASMNCCSFAEFSVAERARARRDEDQVVAMYEM